MGGPISGSPIKYRDKCMSVIKRWLKGCIFTSFLMLLSNGVIAYQVQPIAVSLSPVGRDATRDVKIINAGSVPIAIQVSMVTRRQNIDGSENRKPADSEFMVYPQQVVIKAKSVQNVRIQWLGEQHVVREKNYRFIMRQIPVSLKYPNSANKGLKFSLIMEGSLYITPKKPQSNIIVNAAMVRGNQLDVILTNQGNTHSFLINTELTLIQGEHTVRLKGREIHQIEDQNILSGSRRLFSIPLPRGIQTGQPISAAVTYNEVMFR